MNPQLPEHWLVGRTALREACETLAGLAPTTAAENLRLPTLPAYYDDFCRRYFIALRMHHPGLAWRHVEPLFALAVASQHHHAGTGTEACLAFLAGIYERMRADSPLAWRHAGALLDQAWSALRRLQENKREA